MYIYTHVYIYIYIYICIYTYLFFLHCRCAAQRRTLPYRPVRCQAFAPHIVPQGSENTTLRAKKRVRAHNARIMPQVWFYILGWG